MVEILKPTIFLPYRHQLSKPDLHFLFWFIIGKAGTGLNQGYKDAKMTKGLSSDDKRKIGCSPLLNKIVLLAFQYNIESAVKREQNHITEML